MRGMHVKKVKSVTKAPQKLDYESWSTGINQDHLCGLQANSRAFHFAELTNDPQTPIL